MNLYLVVSETLYEKIPITDWGEGPMEPYSLCDLVKAESREQARWILWQTDRNASSDAYDMPNFRTRKLNEGYNSIPDLVGDLDEFQFWWNSKKVNDLLSSLGSW